MNQFNLGNFLNKFINYSQQNAGNKPPSNSPANANAAASPDVNLPPTSSQGQVGTRSFLPPPSMPQIKYSQLYSLKMNTLASLEKSAYIKDLMSLPREMKDILVLIQNKATMSKEVTNLMNTNINLASLVEIMQKGGKDAMNKLVFAMAEASKQGVSDISQIKDAIKLVNASMSVPAQDNQAQVLKNFMLLYLPWLPLQEGVDFELDIESSEGENGESETVLTIMISTRKYGNVKILLLFKGLNSFDIFVKCIESFPKEELLKRISEESKKHSLQSNFTFEQKEEKTSSESITQAKISMSNLNEVNPFLLLMANALIRHTIALDDE